jgi:hypothetical protein
MSNEVVLREGEEVVSPDPSTIPTPTPTHYEQVAAQVLSALAELAKLFPTLEGEHPLTATFVRTHQNVPLEFIQTVTFAVASTPALQGVNKFDVAQGRDVVQFVQAFRPVYDELTRLARTLKFTMDARRASMAADSLQIYNIAKGIARDPNSTDVVSHVENMKRDLGRKKRPKGTGNASPNAPAAPKPPFVA